MTASNQSGILAVHQVPYREGTMLRKVNFIFLAGLFLAAISLTFSATGLVHLFAGAGAAIIVMAIAFEMAKVATTVYLINNLRFRLVPILLSVALVCLVGISSIGIYGYLGKAYNEGRAEAVIGAGAIQVLQQEVVALEQERDRLYAQIEAVPPTHSTNRRRLLEQLQPRIDEISGMLDAKRAELATEQRAQVGRENSIGEYKYAAELFGLTEDGLAKLVITVLAFLLDPLAVLLIMASGVKSRLARKESEGGAQDTEQVVDVADKVMRIEPRVVDVSSVAGASGDVAGFVPEPSLRRQKMGKALNAVLDRVQRGVMPRIVGNEGKGNDERLLIRRTERSTSDSGGGP